MTHPPHSSQPPSQPPQPPRAPLPPEQPQQPTPHQQQPHPSQQPLPPQMWHTNPTGSPASGPAAPGNFGPPPEYDSYAPTQPASPAAGPPNAAKPRRAGRTALIGVLALVLLAGLGGAGWALWPNDGPKAGTQADTKPHSVKAKLDWLVPALTDDDDRNTVARRTWFAYGNVVHTSKSAVTAYAQSSGKKRWSIPLSGKLCGAAPRAYGDMTAVVYSDGTECSQLMAVDLKSGKKKWDRTLAPDSTGAVDYTDPNIMMRKSVVYVTSMVGTAVYSIGRGELEERPTGNGNYECVGAGSAGDGPYILDVVDCQLGKRGFVSGFDPKTGNEKWTWKIPEGVKLFGILSVNPAVVLVGAGDIINPTDVISIDDRGRTRARTSLSSGPYAVGCKVPLDSCGGFVIHKDTLYVSTRGKDTGSGTATNRIAAIDLASGKPRWTAAAVNGRVGTPVAMHDGELLTYQPPQGGEGGRLVTFAPADGRSSVFSKLPAESSADESNTGGKTYYHGGRFFLVSDSDESSRRRLILAFS
ncbi:outer membrane protein assembly factor BamB family protein [Streptomyces sp. H27-D2]|uniref:outer membrane protein assembly factor BamB family protein n=1 Tax=Streptomyces sp. H27-D2 TaxID=3046304 RepID=UPI002DBDAE56|nr:PQQ-binding-like beta-propeller repeat protein [Streptomyces sp. H27-D2]MEC4019168.1 PQQ-binding-like beta-propeller repeat protein [Streptomyces sp. H27-D2]